MKVPRIGVFLHSYALPMQVALEKALEDGFRVVQLWNIGGDHDPKRMTGRARQRLLRQLEQTGTAISSLCGHLPLCDPALAPMNIAKLNSVIQLADLLDVELVTTESGSLQPNQNFASAWQTLVSVLDSVCSAAALRNRVVCIEAGSRALVNSPELLLRLVDEVDSPALAVNLDPANLWKAGHDPVRAVEQLAGHIRHVHAKDACWVNGGFVESPLGEGAVPLERFFRALALNGYCGDVAIEREAGQNRQKDILAARDLLEDIFSRVFV